jgi:hypothetical protein
MLLAVVTLLATLSSCRSEVAAADAASTQKLSLPSCELYSAIQRQDVAFIGIGTLEESSSAADLGQYLRHLWSSVDVVFESETAGLVVKPEVSSWSALLDVVLAVLPHGNSLRPCQPAPAKDGRSTVICSLSPYSTTTLHVGQALKGRVYCKTRFGTRGCVGPTTDPDRCSVPSSRCERLCACTLVHTVPWRPVVGILGALMFMYGAKLGRSALVHYSVGSLLAVLFVLLYLRRSAR